ncbi:hypothetical protein SAMN05192588_2899 [Nonlabens sp. Hel1_33_55]|uniref:hypothetical protein n=1 Tax=Nonlabens sp. Hel1_33_55 TaxID=1336802 RepID=UPI000875BA78|nr:hypothetical protein [Nonlabens sp. Hel1_33_55]SCY43933.1 hypothetical protein SAMN05192588_2899 [Nonlabens sp. Hel1_33_55]
MEFVKNRFLLLFVFTSILSFSQIEETDLVIGMVNGNELYGKAEIPRKPNRPIELKQSEFDNPLIIQPEEIEFIILDILVTTKNNFFFPENPKDEEERLYLITYNLGTAEKPEWVYARELISGDLSYYGYRITAKKKSDFLNSAVYSDTHGNTIYNQVPIDSRYTYKVGRYFYKTFDGSIIIEKGSKASFLSKNADVLMSDCQNLVNSIKEKKRFEEGEVDQFIYKYNQGCY